MEEKWGQSTAVLFKYEKLILAEEETTSAGGCGVSLAAFSRPASACPMQKFLVFTDRKGKTTLETMLNRWYIALEKEYRNHIEG